MNCCAKTAIKDSLIRYYLFRGTVLAGLGGIILLFSGVFLPLLSLSEMGIPIFILGIGLITCGLLPYRRLWRLELNPCELVADDNYLSLFHRGKRLLCIPQKEIAKIQYFEEKHAYGLRVNLKTKLQKKTIFYNKIKLNPYYKIFSGGDLLLLNFSEKTMKYLSE